MCTYYFFSAILNIWRQIYEKKDRIVLLILYIVLVLLIIINILILLKNISTFNSLKDYTQTQINKAE